MWHNTHPEIPLLSGILILKSIRIYAAMERGVFEYFWGKKYENIYFALDNHWYLISSLNLHADVKICLCIHALAILLTNNQK